jgi:hypothetical protein
MASDRFPAALWLVARFDMSERRPDVLDVTRPDAVLASARVEIETEIAAMLRGHKSGVVTELCLGAVVLREVAPTAHEWVVATAPLRSPCCQRQYNQAFDISRNRIAQIRRLASVLAGAGKISAAEALWVLDSKPTRRAA